MQKKKNEEHENHERWLVSYADFITLLFAFFVVMYATSQADVEKQQKFEKSVNKAFGVVGLKGADQDGILKTPFPAHLREGSVIESPIKIFENPNSSKTEIRDAIWQILHDKMTDEEIQKAGLKIEDDSQGVRITLLSEKIFPESSARILPEALTSLDKIGDVLKKTNRPLIVEGHTDNSLIQSEQYPSNWELSAARASTVIRYLIKRHKIDGEILSLSAFADQKPIYPNNSDQNKSKNRRIEIVISI